MLKQTQRRAMKHFMKSLVLLSLWLWICPMLAAQSVRLDKGARAIGVGGAFTGLANSAFALFYNPAGLMLLSSREVSFFYAQPFGLTELADFCAAYADPQTLPQGFGAFGAAVRRFGFELYNETALSIAYANVFERRFFFGVNLSYQLTAVKGYGNAGAFGVDAGILVLITPELSLGVSAINLNRPSMGISSEPLAQVYMAGLSYRLLKNLRAFLDVEKDIRYPLSFKSGLEFDAVQYVSLRAGFSTEPQRISGGIGVHYAMVDADYAFLTHPELGLSHHLTLSLRLGGTSETAQDDFDRLIDEAFMVKPPIKEGERINLNTATFQDLMRLPRMTRVLADRILRYRQEYKRFESVEELKNIRGISEALFAAWQRFLFVEP
jgi:competence ComEA-like helix-hairpin-helix protein